LISQRKRTIKLYPKKTLYRIFLRKSEYINASYVRGNLIPNLPDITIILSIEGRKSLSATFQAVTKNI